jgi:hypothetical protein
MRKCADSQKAHAVGSQFIERVYSHCQKQFERMIIGSNRRGGMMGLALLIGSFPFFTKSLILACQTSYWRIYRGFLWWERAAKDSKCEEMLSFLLFVPYRIALHSAGVLNAYHDLHDDFGNSSSALLSRYFKMFRVELRCIISGHSRWIVNVKLIVMDVFIFLIRVSFSVDSNLSPVACRQDRPGSCSWFYFPWIEFDALK